MSPAAAVDGRDRRPGAPIAELTLTDPPHPVIHAFPGC